jgi:hypothetical protein
VRECADYLTVALRAAETSDSEREELNQTIQGGKDSLDDARLALRLIVRNAACSARASFEELLRADEQPLRTRLLAGLERDFASWAVNLRIVSERFDDWLRAAITQEMAQTSREHQDEFLEPLRHVNRQLAQSLQDFRNRLSARTLEALGLPLRTTGAELGRRRPRAPDVRVGKIFDRNWELLSFAIPISLVKPTLKRHFKRKVGDVVFMNLSRLASQWEDVVNASLLELEKESIRQLEALSSTIERLVTAAGHEAAGIREDLNRLNEVAAGVQE